MHIVPTTALLFVKKKRWSEHFKDPWNNSPGNTNNFLDIPYQNSSAASNMDLIGDVPICFEYCTLICSSVLVPQWSRDKQGNVSSLMWTLLLFVLKISTALSTGVHQGCVLSPLLFTQLTCDMCIHTWKPDHKMCRWHHRGSLWERWNETARSQM